MGITFEITELCEAHPNHYMIVVVFESGERLEVIGFKDKRACKVIVDKLRIIYRNCRKKGS